MKRILWFGFVFLMIAALLAGCAPLATPTPAPAAPPKAAGGTIKIGMPAELTGTFSANAMYMRDGLIQYLEEKNYTLGGRKVELIVEDTEAKPDVGLTKVKKLVERDKVNILAGIISSGVAFAVGDYVVSQKVPLLILNAGDDPLTQQKASPYIFRDSFTLGQITHVTGDWAYKKGYRKVAIVMSDFPAGWQAAGGFARVFTQAGGRIIQEIYAPLGTPDFAPYITAINREADVVFVFVAEALKFVLQYTEFGLKGKIPLIGAAMTMEDVLQQQGDAALGIVNVHTFFPTIDRSQAKRFVAAFEKRFNRPVHQIAEYGYVGGQILDMALQSIGGNIENTDAFIKAMEKVELDTPSSPIKFDQYHQVIRDLYYAEVKKVDGKYVNVIFDKIPQVSQFWKWSPEEYLKMPMYNDLKGTWVK